MSKEPKIVIPLPKTINDAIEFILKNLDEETKNNIASITKENLISLHHGFGTWIRNNLGLWTGNDELLKNTGKKHPDDASMVIIRALWEKLNEKSKTRYEILKSK